MNIFALYLLMLKAVMTSFSGMASLPMVRDDLVETRHVLTDRQLATAIVAGRTGPGPNGLYLVSVGYFVAGVPGAAVSFIALITPAFLVIPLIHWLGQRAKHPRIRGAIRAVILSSAGLVGAAAIPLTRDAATGALTSALIVASFLVLTFTEVETWWVMGGAAAVSLAAYFV
ncbi:MAG: chromate transporter [Bryobacteraceae bacterium]